MRINIELDKKPDFLKLSLKFSGTARVLCDRCLEEFDIPLDFDSALYIKFGEEGNENDADVIFLDPGEHKFNLADYFIESIRLNIPLKKVHENIEKEGLLCNREMIRKLNEHTVTVKNGETDPRWDSLRNLISNRN